ncbi:MAG: hypothetical protein WBB85_04815 [Albidovulum sp.]|uniref:hypothetical protein n=1 Tax=Albidovulum sp. TaxID=1872424 RepID=UPI003CBA8D1C
MTDMETENWRRVLSPNERVLIRVPHPTRVENLKTLRVIALVATSGFAVALFALPLRGAGAWSLAMTGMAVGPYLFVLWLRSTKTHFVLTEERAVRFVDDRITDEFPWKDSERPILLARGKPVSDAGSAMEQHTATTNVLLRLRLKRPFSWKRSFLGGNSRILPIPNRSDGPTAREILEASQSAWEAAQ